MSDDLMRKIAQIAVEVRKTFDGKYDPDLLDLFTFVAKYMTLAYLPRDDRGRAGVITVSRYCPLCLTRGIDSGMVTCSGCVLAGDQPGFCGDRYTMIRQVLFAGNAPDMAFALSKAARDLVKRVSEREAPSVSSNTTEV